MMVEIYKEGYIKMLITINYDPKNGDAFPDGNCREFCNNACKSNSDVTINTSTFLLIDWFRVAVKNKTISIEKLIITYKGENIEINADGKFKAKLPEGIGCDKIRVSSILALRS
jgi:hypothetical protein